MRVPRQGSTRVLDADFEDRVLGLSLDEEVQIEFL